MQRLLTLFFVLATVPAFAGGTSVEVGRFAISRATGESSCSFSILTEQRVTAMNGANIFCTDQHAIQSVSFYGLKRADLERLRELVDKAIAALGKK